MSLLQKASIITTPTAYAEDYLYSIKPAYALGSELVTQFDDVADGTDVTTLAGWAAYGVVNSRNVVDEKLVINISAGNTGAVFNFTTETDKKYLFTCNITGDLGLGGVYVQSTNPSPFAVVYTNNLDTSSGKINLVLSGLGVDSQIYFRASNNNAGITTYSDISVKEITDADFDFDRNSTGTRVNEDYLIETVATNTPRIDYTNGEPSILLEPSRTNLVTYSQDFSQWSTISASATDDYATSPEGITNASRFLTTSTGAYLYLSSISVSNSTEYTISVYAKSNGNNLDDFRIYTSLGDSSTLTATSEWQRFTYTFTTSTTSINIGFRPSSTQNADIQVFGYQIEQGSYATSLIHTSGSAVTRSADAANNAGNSDLFNDSEGVLYLEIAALANESSVRQLAISDGTANEAVKILYLNSTQIRIELKTASGTDFVKDVTVTTNQFQKIALQYKASNYKVFLNGEAQSVTQTSAVASGLDRFNFDRGDGADDWYGKVKSVMVFKEALTDLELEKLTGYNNHELYMNYYNRLSYLGLAEEYNVESDINNYIL